MPRNQAPVISAPHIGRFPCERKSNQLGLPSRGIFTAQMAHLLAIHIDADGVPVVLVVGFRPELGLAHQRHAVTQRGLFLDKVREFEPVVLDNLRQRLEDGVIPVARADAQVTFPARVLLERQRPMSVGMGRRRGVDPKDGAADGPG